MLEHWYFCSSLGLPPQTAATQLELLTALAEEPGTDRSEELVSSSIESLSRAGTATALYALPHVLAAQRRFAGVTEVSARASALYRDIASVAPEEVRARLGAALRAAGGSETPKALAALGDLLRELPEDVAEADPSIPPYHDLIEQLAPTATLVVARFLAGRDPRAAGELLDDHPALIDEALAGRHGRFALLQAAEVRGALHPDSTEKIRTALATASRGAFDMEPDLLATAARVTFPLARDVGPEETARTLDAVEREALSGEALLGWIEEWRRAGVLPARGEDDARRAAYLRLGGVGNLGVSAMPSVLWESVLWSLAAGHDPTGTTNRLVRWWRSPEPRWRVGKPSQFPVTLPHTSYGDVVRHVHRLLTLRHPAGQYPLPMLTDGPAEGTDPQAAAWLWSPWLHHHTPRIPARAGKQGAAAAVPAPTPHLRDDQPEQLVRLLGAGLLAARLLTYVPSEDDTSPGTPDGEGEEERKAAGSAVGERDHLLLLVVHLRDTLHRTFVDLMDTVHGDPRKAVPYAGQLTSLLLHASVAVDWIGKGARVGVHPAEIVRVVSAPPGPPDSPLPAWGARNVALHWVQEALAGGAGPHRTEAGGRWFSGDAPPADALLTLIREQERSPYTSTAVRAARLHRDLHAHSRHDVLRWDWTPDGPHFPGLSPAPRLTLGVLTLSGPGDPGRDSFSVEEWREMAQGLTDLLKVGDKHAIVPVAVHTLRLAALLGRPELGDQGAYQDWVTEWSGRVTSLNTPTHLPRTIRSRMFDMFRSEVEGAGSQERLRTVLEHVVDVIVDLCGNAQFFYDRLLDELTSSGLPPEMANRLRVRVLRALYHRWGGRPTVASHESPWGTYLGRVSGRGTEAALVRFLRATAAEQLQGQGIPLAHVMDTLWHRTQRPAGPPAVREPSGRVAADPRFVVAATHDRRAGETVVYARNENGSAGVDLSRRPFVQDLFRPAPDAAHPVPYPAPGSYVLGIVCSAPLGTQAGDLWVNCGLERPVLCRIEPGEKRRHLGQTVAVRFPQPADEGQPNTERPRPYVVPLAPLPPRDGEVREAWLHHTDRFPGLRLFVDGIPSDTYPRAATDRAVKARSRWDPDLARAFRVEGPPGRSHVLARWHQRLDEWVPLDAGLPELAVAAGTTARTATDTAAGPPQALTTTPAGDPGLGEATPVRLVLAGPATERSGFGAAWRFVTTPGNCYVLGPPAWDTEDWHRLEEACLAAPAGLVVHAEFRPGGSRLSLAPKDPFDLGNVQWLGVFDHTGGVRDHGEDDERAEEEGLARDRHTHEEAHLRTDTAGRPEWQIDVPEIDGFPRTVKALFTAAVPQARSVLCSVESWGDAGARKPEVTVQPFPEHGILEPKPTPEQYAWYARVPRNTVVELGWTSHKAFNAFNSATTKDGLRGLVATDSLTLTGLFSGPTPTSRRWAVVLSDYVADPKESLLRTAPAPLPAERLTDHRVPACDPALLDRARLGGIVVAQIKEGGQVTLVRVWFDLGTYVAVAVLPVTCLNIETPQTGDHLTGVRGPGGWLFEVQRRMLHLEALWERVPQPGTDWKQVGQARDDDGAPLVVLQDPRGPRLATEPASGEPEAGGRVSVRRGSTKRTGDSFPVVVQHEGAHLVGHAAGIELADAFRPAHLEQTVVDVWDVGHEVTGLPTWAAGTRFVRARREFELSPVGSARRPAAAPVRRVHDPVAEWHRLLEQPGLTLTGQLTDDGDRMLLSTCAAPDDQGVHRPWLELLDEPRAWVAGRNYPTDQVRAVPVEHGAGYRASFLRAAPLSVVDFMAAFAPYATADGRRCDFRDRRHTKGRPQYVGVEENDSGTAARFEFGFGWFVDVPVEALLVGGEPLDPDGLTLFHGDQIDAMTFTADETDAVPGGISVAIELTDIDKNAERQIHWEATTASIVHLLDVTVDRDRGRVTVHRAVTRSRGLGRTREDDHTEARPVSAVIDRRDQDALLAGLDAGTERRLLLGRLIPETTARRQRALRFATVRPSAATGEGDAGLHRDDQLYLEAGPIQETRNDHLLRFALPAELRQEGEPLTVVVPRRDFSHRESCLRRAAKTEGLGAYQGRARMLVQLGNHNSGGHTNQWHGMTKSPPARGIETLRSYLRLRPEGCFGVVDAHAERIELRPGVVFDIAGMTGVDGIAPGSVVRLTLAGPDGDDGPDGVRVHQAIPADITYLDDVARPMVVFPKDSLKYAEDIRDADRIGRFTVAGLPGLNATARPNLGAGLLRTPHPKIAGVVRRVKPNGKVHPQLVPPGELRAGTLAFDAEDAPGGVRVVPVGGAANGPTGATDTSNTSSTTSTSSSSGPPDVVADGPADSATGGTTTGRHPVPWAQLSFLDAPAQQLATACENWGWHYHDSRTRTWPENGDAPVAHYLAAVARSVDEPVFFSARGGGWTLRHEPSALRQYGFPATELLEETFQDLPGARRTHWAVARAHEGSVWLELTPGRVAEVRGELVRFTDGHSLAGLDWSRFAPGDLLYGHVEGGVNECGHLVLDDWRPGLRGSLPADRPYRVLLSVSHADEERGALYLGEGEASLPYPAERDLIARHPAGSAVWLDEANELTAASDRSPSRGDVVLLTADPAGGGLRIAGLPGAGVELAEVSEQSRNRWLRSQWLRDDLAAAAGRGSTVLRALGALPVTVESVVAAEQGGGRVVTVSRRHQRAGFWPDGTILARPVADLGGGHLVMRAGAALVRTHVNDLLPGLPTEAAEATAATLVADRRLLRLHWDRGHRKLTSGLPTVRSAQGETVVRALLAVNGPDGTCLGVLCRDERSQALCWLPARDAAWTGGVPGELLVAHLRAARRLTVARRGGSAVSLVHHPLVAREYENLAAGQLARVGVVGVVGETAAAAKRARALLVSVGSLGVLALYTSGVGTHRPGESMMAEVSRLEEVAGRGTVQFVEPGSRRTVVDLPDWLCRSLGRLWLPTFASPAEPVTGLVPDDFAQYRAAYQAGIEGKPLATGNSAGKVLRALGALEAPSGRNDAEAKETAAAAVADWIRSPLGRTVVLQEDAPADLAPVLAVCRIGALLTRQESGLPHGWVAYLLARVGERAVSSLHTEALVTEWLTRPERHLLAGDWRRLRSVSMARYLRPGQVTSVEGFARAVTGRPTLLEQGEAGKVARGLLASVGRLSSAERLQEDAPLMTRLARLGLSLSPAPRRAVPEWLPLTAQDREVEKVFSQVIRFPLTLMPAYVPLSAEGERYGAALLRGAEGLRAGE
ncbi:hypothetical protein OG462_36795 [Streptomyces sp. NBC_01077]|uniref:hypothetical protein n=1 Tax=Streptomyces sp. NBC_01077 TaxID=2903746 RepID=UPI00386A8EE4|nr:hypothetical protein OG462_36795 [Streptomyces sp. NBC_01077]